VRSLHTLRGGARLRRVGGTAIIWRKSHRSGSGSTTGLSMRRRGYKAGDEQDRDYEAHPCLPRLQRSTYSRPISVFLLPEFTQGSLWGEMCAEANPSRGPGVAGATVQASSRLTPTRRNSGFRAAGSRGQAGRSASTRSASDACPVPTGPTHQGIKVGRGSARQACRARRGRSFALSRASLRSDARR
jgi:hypothetical protein